MFTLPLLSALADIRKVCSDEYYSLNAESQVVRARYLLTNDYSSALAEAKTRCSSSPTHSCDVHGEAVQCCAADVDWSRYTTDVHNLTQSFTSRRGRLCFTKLSNEPNAQGLAMQLGQNMPIILGQQCNEKEACDE